jgi:hypothetical protein
VAWNVRGTASRQHAVNAEAQILHIGNAAASRVLGRRRRRTSFLAFLRAPATSPPVFALLVLAIVCPGRPATRRRRRGPIDAGHAHALAADGRAGSTRDDGRGPPITHDPQPTSSRRPESDQ